MKKLLAMLFFASAVVCLAGSSPCPTPGFSNVNGNNQPYLNNGGGCNVVITIAPNGAVSTQTTNSAPYDGSEDTLVGVVNNSSTPISQFTVSGTGISGWDVDGICTYAPGGTSYQNPLVSGSLSYCTNAQIGGTDPQDYYGPNMTFTNYSSGSDVTVVMTTPIAASGGTAFFSLERPPSTALTVTISTPPPVPVPPSVWMAMIGLLALGGYFMYQRKAVV